MELIQKNVSFMIRLKIDQIESKESKCYIFNNTCNKTSVKDKASDSEAKS